MIAGRRAAARALLCLLALAAAPGGLLAPAAARPAASEPIAAVAVGVDDGDSFVARKPDGAKIRVRIAGIDAPEKSQPWAALARQRLRALLVGKEVRIQPLKTDPWGRYVALVEVDGEDPALAMIEGGLAWHFARYDRDLPPALRPRYALAEAQARERGAGLWQAPDPEPPWDFRKRNPR